MQRSVVPPRWVLAALGGALVAAALMFWVVAVGWQRLIEEQKIRVARGGGPARSGGAGAQDGTSPPAPGEASETASAVPNPGLAGGHAEAAPPPAHEEALRILERWRTFLNRSDSSVRSWDWEELRSGSIAELTALGPSAMEPLRQAARDSAESPAFRAAALQALMRVDPAAGVDVAIELALSAGPTPLRSVAITSLEKPADPRIVPALARVLDDTGYTGRYLAAHVLGLRKEPAALPFLQRSLAGDADVSVRCHAAAAIGDLGDLAGWEALTSAVASDASPKVRERVAAALAHLDPNRARPILEALRSEDPDPGVQRVASLLLAPPR